jgi:serine acetyltransferase/GT2 family glycosyltransferase
VTYTNGTNGSASPAVSPAPAVSIIIPNYNRPELVRSLLEELDKQTLDAKDFEVIVVDDGSREDPRPRLSSLHVRFALTVVRQENQGAAAARDHGAKLARADVVVFIDDDMRVGPDFLKHHLSIHAETPHAVVLGRMRPDARLAEMPLFERFHAKQLDRLVDSYKNGKTPRGNELFTGNVSMRREDYFAVGGFDRSLKRSEDAELGLRLERHGSAFVYSEDAYTIHGSDHVNLDTWLKRGFLYGICDLRIWRKHPELRDASPWRFVELLNPVARPFVTLAVVAPGISLPVARVATRAALLADKVKLEKLALPGITLVFAMEYFRGVRDENGGLWQSLMDYRKYRAIPKTEKAMDNESGRPKGLGSAWKRMVRGIRADHAKMQHYQGRYADREREEKPQSIAKDLVQRVGFQMMAGYRLMRFCVEGGIPVAPKVISRTMRILYGSDIHWEAEFDDGVVIVHGMGMAISRSAKVGSGSILFQNITLAESSDPVTRKVGAPIIEENVHIGPGSSLIGPVTVGANSKLVAGSVVLKSVPAGSRVIPATANVVQPSAKSKD